MSVVTHNCVSFKSRGGNSITWIDNNDKKRKRKSDYSMTFTLQLGRFYKPCSTSLCIGKMKLVSYQMVA